MTSEETSNGPLSRFTVLDLTRVRAGPTAVRQLADWGADVIQIELPERVEAGAALGGPREGSDFQNLHRNKRSMTLNLKSPEGREILRRLAAKADVVVENYRPDVKHRLGIDFETLSAINPRLVYASISGFGQDGPYRDRPGFDLVTQGMSGLMSVTGLEGQGPVRTGIAISDTAAGISCAYGILLALLEREASGQGQWVQTSLLEAAIFFLDFQAARWLIDKEVPGQAGNHHPTTIPQGVFETSDHPINVGAAGQPMWKSFCRVIGAEELTDHPDYADRDGRSINREALHWEINDRMQSRDSKTWVRLFNEAGIPAGEIYSIDQVFEDPQVQHLGLVQSVPSRAHGPVDVVGQPVHLSRTPSRLRTGTPDRGEHTRQILETAGYSTDEIDEFIRHEVV